MLKIIRASALAMSCMVAASPTIAADGGKKPFKVVVIADMTGPVMSAYVPGAQGFQAFVDYKNRNGGVAGHPIDLEVWDEQSSPSVASALFQRAASSSLLAIAHFGLSTAMTLGKPIMEDVPIAILTAGADDSMLYPTPSKNIFMINASAKQQATALVLQAEQLIGGLKGKKIALALAQTTYFDSMVTVVQKMAEQKGFQVVLVERFTVGTPSFTSQGAKIARANPDAVLMGSATGDAPIVATSISTAGVTKAPIIAFSAMSSVEVFRKVNLPNYYAFRPYNVGTEVPSLAAKAGPAFTSNMSGSNWTLGWTTAEVLANALSICGDECAGDKLMGILQRGEPVSVEPGVLYGPVLFTKSGHAGLTKVQPYKMDGDRVVPDGNPINIAD